MKGPGFWVTVILLILGVQAAVVGIVLLIEMVGSVPLILAVAVLSSGLIGASVLIVAKRRNAPVAIIAAIAVNQIGIATMKALYGSEGGAEVWPGILGALIIVPAIIGALIAHKLTGKWPRAAAPTHGATDA